MNTVYLGFTNTFNPFDDERVRRALAMAVDRQKLVDTFFPSGSSAKNDQPIPFAGDAWTMTAAIGAPVSSETTRPLIDAGGSSASFNPT